MKKLLVLFVVVVVFGSCSEDNVESSSLVGQSSLSVLDGELLSFKDDESFINEYSELSELKSSKEMQDWILDKGHTSLLNVSNASEGIEDSIVSNTRIVYSDAIKAIVNADSKFKIEGKVLWLNERNLYILTEKDLNKNLLELKTMKNDLDVYGIISNLNVNQKPSIVSRNVIPNENRIKTFVKDLPNSKRNILDLFNETIVMNDQIVSSKMFLRSIFQYRSCSFWRCTWKTDTAYCQIETNGSLNCDVCGDYKDWILYSLYGELFTGSKTFLLASWTGGTPPQLIGYSNFAVSGDIRWKTASSSYSYLQPISWY